MLPAIVEVTAKIALWGLHGCILSVALSHIRWRRQVSPTSGPRSGTLSSRTNLNRCRVQMYVNHPLPRMPQTGMIMHFPHVDGILQIHMTQVLIL
ncbi:hypothetical protein GGP41_008867 [Bipolaris sorokiniana]|uniref:Uncharacterized protein n=1 Tax=Cochliobolus sativus TaxID=45130 RepID=A0A8H6DR01_COCSA|nr:hypothetical protein GGP41_008867 [Bipolaris sorokiniana]